MYYFQWIKKMKCSGDTGLGIESFQDINVGVDDEEVDEDDESYDTVNEEELLEQFLLNGNSLDSREDASIEIQLPSHTIVSGTFRTADSNILITIRLKLIMLLSQPLTLSFMKESFIKISPQKKT